MLPPPRLRLCYAAAAAIVDAPRLACYDMLAAIHAAMLRYMLIRDAHACYAMPPHRTLPLWHGTGIGHALIFA